MKQILRIVNGCFMLLMAVTLLQTLSRNFSFQYALMFASFVSTGILLIVDFRNIKLKGKIRE